MIEKLGILSSIYSQIFKYFIIVAKSKTIKGPWIVLIVLVVALGFTMYISN